MTTSEIKSELNSAREAVKAYRLAKDKANAYGQLLMGGKTVKYNNDDAVHERDGNSVERAYCCLADYEAEADRLLEEMNRARQRAERLIDSVSDSVQKEVLIRRYIIGQSWEDIAFCLGYSLRRVYQLHGYALKNISLYFT